VGRRSEKYEDFKNCDLARLAPIPLKFRGVSSRFRDMYEKKREKEEETETVKETNGSRSRFFAEAMCVQCIRSRN